MLNRKIYGYAARVDLARFWPFGPNRPNVERMSADRPTAQFGLEIPPELLEVMKAEGVAPRIGRAEALQVPAVMRARNLIAGTLATLPLKHVGPDKWDVDWPLFDQPDPNLPTSVMLALTFEDLLFEGIAWWRVTARRSDGFPASAIHIDHRAVHVPPAFTGRPSEQQISPDHPFPAGGDVFVDGVRVPMRDMIQFLSPNPPLLVHAARAIRTALRLDRTASMYADEPMPLGYFRRPDGADPPSDEEIQTTLDGWAANRRKRAWGYVGGLALEKLGFDAEQIQLADQRNHAVLEIARATGVDPEDLGVSTTSRTYQNSEHRRQDLLDFTLGAYVSAFQDRLSMRDVLPRRHQARMMFSGFLRSTTPTRWAAYKDGLETGAITEDEIRDLEDRPRLTPAQRGRADQRGDRTAGPPTDRRTPAMSNGHSSDAPARLQPLKFSADEPVRVQFDADEIEAFQVDVEKRTITGLAVPWGKVARSGFSKWRFAPDSLRWSDASRVKLNLNHDFTQLIGRATRLQSGSRGLMTTYKVARGVEGDRALTLAEDKILDGFSIEVEFDESKGDNWQPDPSDESVRLVRQASLRGTALTGMPAFDDARVTGVKATRDGGKGTMPEDNKPDSGAGQGTVALSANEFTTFMEGLAGKLAESHQNLSKELGESIGESVAAGMKAALENIHDPQRDGPEPVRAARFQVTREAPVYTFDGRGPSLVRDAWYAQREHDSDAQERIRKFHGQTAEVQKLVSSHVAFQAGNRLQFATVDTTSASEVIPPGYRPDLFVPQLEQGRPFVNSLSRGTIANATPFTVPTFGSLTGGTGDHTEGQPATEGTLTLGTKTVTPGAISGKLPLTREIVDSANPAIDQIALAAMREDYARQTEQKVYTLLNGSDGQGGTIDPDGFVPSGAQVFAVSSATGGRGGPELLDKVREALALYPFRRFGAPNRALMSQEATTAFATAKDANERPLLPSVGAQNSAGIGNAVQVGWFVDGLPHIPAWAITGNAAGDADTFTLNSADAWAWESPVLAFRFEEKQGPEIIELALFGYFVTHLLRPVGLSAIRLSLV